jgi:hypothetical protein
MSASSNKNLQGLNDLSDSRFDVAEYTPSSAS